MNLPPLLPKINTLAGNAAAVGIQVSEYQIIKERLLRTR
jgi:hemoglobin-like flavoprotein